MLSTLPTEQTALTPTNFKEDNRIRQKQPKPCYVWHTPHQKKVCRKTTEWFHLCLYGAHLKQRCSLIPCIWIEHVYVLNTVTKAYILKSLLGHYSQLKTYMGCLNSHSSIHQIRSLILQWPTTHVPFCTVWHESRVAVLTYLRMLFLLSYIYELNIIKWLDVIRSSMFLYLVWWKDYFRWFSDTISTASKWLFCNSTYSISIYNIPEFSTSFSG